MILKEMFRVAFILLILIRNGQGTIDVNFPEYQYLADHLTEKECRQLVTALHFREFQLPKRLDDAEQKLPRDVSCVNLLLHWNSLPRGGKGETHVDVSHRLCQIGRQDLADWLTETVFRQLSNDLKNSLTSPRIRKSVRKIYTTESYTDKETFIDEAAWWKLDTFLSTVLVLGTTTCFVGAIFLCYLHLTRNPNFN